MYVFPSGVWSASQHRVSQGKLLRDRLHCAEQLISLGLWIGFAGETNTICVSAAKGIAPIDFQLTQLFGEFCFPGGLKSECSSRKGFQIEADCYNPKIIHLLADLVSPF